MYSITHCVHMYNMKIHNAAEHGLHTRLASLETTVVKLKLHCIRLWQRATSSVNKNGILDYFSMNLFS